MKILVISNYKDSYISVRPEGEIFIGLQKSGHSVSIMTQPDGAFIENFLEAGIRIIDFQPNKKFSRSGIKFIRQELIKEKHDILLLMNSKAISNGNIASINLPVKVLVYRGVIGGSHWLNPNSYFKHLHPRVDRVFAVSKAVQSYLKQQIWWNPTKVLQVYKGQNLAWYEDIIPINREELGLPSNAFLVACIANNRKIKGVRYLLESAAFLPPNLPIHFLLIGRKMDIKENLEIIQNSSYSKQIHLLGYRKDVGNILATCQVYVQPTLENKEGLGKAILEAMCLKVPPIVTNSGGPIEFVENGVSGFHVPSKSGKAIADKILYLYQNEEIRAKMGQKAQDVIKGKMSIEQSVLGLNEIFRGLGR